MRRAPELLHVYLAFGVPRLGAGCFSVGLVLGTRLADELIDRRDAADLHSDLTSSWERCEESPWLDMSAVTGVVARTSSLHLMC